MASKILNYTDIENSWIIDPKYLPISFVAAILLIFAMQAEKIWFNQSEKRLLALSRLVAAKKGKYSKL